MILTHTKGCSEVCRCHEMGEFQEKMISRLRPYGSLELDELKR